MEKSGQTIARAMQNALDSANLIAEDIDYINAHGCSLPNYDVSETNAIKIVFKDRAYRIPISSIKSMIGQSLAPSSGFQMISSCLTLRDDILPPTINYDYPEPDCDLDYVPNTARHNRVQTVLMNSHSVGGTHSAIIIGRYKDEYGGGNCEF